MLSEALLPKEFDGIIVSICSKVLHSNRLGMNLQSVQDKSTISISLEFGCNREEDDFDKSLGWKWAKYTATNDFYLTLIITSVGF